MRLHEVPRLEGAEKAVGTSAFVSKNIFSLSLTSVYLLLSGVESYLFHMITHIYSHTLSGTSLDEEATCRRDLYLTTHNTHNRQTSMSRPKFETPIPQSERLQTYVLIRAVTGMGSKK
jgi:hypothetical protein